MSFLATYSAPTTSAPTTTTSKGPTVDPTTLVYRIDLVLLILIFVFAAFNAPRALARFAARSERFQGFLLRSTTLSLSARRPRLNANTNSIYLHSDPQKTALSLGGGVGAPSTDYVHAGYYNQSVPHIASESTHNEKLLPRPPYSLAVQVSAQQAWHMPMLSSVAPPLARLLHRRVHEGYSLGQILVMAGYAVVVLYAGLYQQSPFVDSTRNGWVAVSQLPFVYVLATKNNVIGMLVGVGYEKLNFLHRFAGRLVVVAANVHALGFIYSWSIAGTLSKSLLESSNRWGLVTLVCVDMLGIFSMQFVRSKSYNFFIVSHVVGFILVLFAVCYHHSQVIPYVTVAIIFYGLDHLVRIIKTRITTATLRPIPELGVTRVEMSSINAGWRAGQHVRLRVLSTGMGLWGMTEVHPFTIASVSKTEEGLVLMCKKVGTWTTKMYEMANTAVYSEQGREQGRSVKVMVEGPYGGVGNTVISSYSGAMFVVGGSGVTFALSAVQDLVRSGNASDVTDIDFVWSIADPGSLTPMIPLFASLISECAAARLRVSVFYTRASSRSLEGMYLPPGITLTPGRPNLGKHLDALVSSTLSAGGCNGVFVGACGPAELAESAGESVRKFDAVRKRTVGGIEFHEEVFGW